MVLVEFSITPLGKGESVGAYVARAVEIVEASGLDYELHSMGTIVEGPWDEVMAVITRCVQALQADCERISLSLKADYRKGAVGRLRSKVQTVERILGRPLRTGTEPATPSDPNPAGRAIG